MPLFVTDVNVLNPDLYCGLSSVFGEVRIAHQGEPRTVSYLPDTRRPGRLKATTKEHGETYIVKCPFCHHYRPKLYINHYFAVRDPKTYSPNLHLFRCFRSNCHQRRNAGKRLLRMLKSHYSVCDRSYLNLPSGDNLTESPGHADLPPNRTPLHLLPTNHIAVQYVRDRGFDPLELSLRWGITFCDEIPELERLGPRLVIPVYRFQRQLVKDGELPGIDLAGWQARSVEANPSQRQLRYHTECAKGSLLYGLPEAVASDKPVVVCEGVTDAWRIGEGAVAVFGIQPSGQQIRLLAKYFATRPIVILFDDGAADAARALQQKLLRSGRRGPNTPVVIAVLPPGRSDPGESTRSELQRCIAAALGDNQGTFSMRSFCDVLDGQRTWLKRTGLSRIGDRCSVAFQENPAHGPLAVVVGEDHRPRLVARPNDRFVASLPGTCIYHNAADARKIELSLRLRPCSSFDDVRIAARLLDPEVDGSLSTLVSNYLPVETQRRLALPGLASAGSHAQRLLHDSLAVRLLYDESPLFDELKQAELVRVYREIELPVVEPVARMMETGLLLDVDRTRQKQQGSKQTARKLRAKITALTGPSFNENDPHQIADSLGRLGVELSPVDHDLLKGHLDRIADRHPLLHLIAKYRKHRDREKWAKQLLSHRDQRTNRVHCNLDQLGAATGRFTCDNPALHNLPRDMRSCVTAGPGRVLIEADFSQIELRVLAHFSQDQKLLSLFQKGSDLHRNTAATVLGKSPQDVTKQERNLGKTVNFAIIYGQTKHGLSQRTRCYDGTSRVTARLLLRRVFRR